ncbi:site-specific integrase [Shewanella sp. Arc9-LZ]|uniref:tyrosine-type recombinase/integrase n=1 Tax=Shewanella sp. Arc9-LZ TaxID=2698686 RepID=UPI00137C2C1C|nr:site-specific integrase [Shewanella sp. Arc9-LZ]QHS12033.1 site-specific integrase [Shewanella sp. Arc9-LZ]
MKKVSIGKFTQKKLENLPLLKPGEDKVAYLGGDERILAVPNLKRTPIVVAMNYSGERYYKTVGNLRDNTWKELEKRSYDFIGKIVNEKFETRSTITVNEFLNDVVLPYSTKHHKDSKGFEQRLNPFVAAHGDDYVSNITKLHIVTLLNGLSDGRASATLARYLAACSKFMSLAIEHEIIEKNPCLGIKKPKESPRIKRFLSKAEIPAFIEAVFRDSNPIHALCLLLSLMTGLRQGNVRSIELSWFSAEFAVLHIPDSKSGRPISHPLSPVAIDVVKLALAYSDGVFLFPSRIPRNFMSKPSKCIARIRCYVQEKTGVTAHFHAHILRKTFATNQLLVTGDLNLVRESLGHADMKTTLIYAFNQNDKLLDANTKTGEAMLGGRALTSFMKQPEEG